MAVKGYREGDWSVRIKVEKEFRVMENEHRSHRKVIKKALEILLS